MLAYSVVLAFVMIFQNPAVFFGTWEFSFTRMLKRLTGGKENNNTPVLKAQSLGIQFGGLKAVTDFNMEIGQSELLGADRS